MENATGNNARTLLKRFFQRYFVDAMSAMALGAFSSLIIGLIMSPAEYGSLSNLFGPL